MKGYKIPWTGQHTHTEELDIDFIHQEDDQDVCDLVETMTFENDNIAQPMVIAVRSAAHTLQLAVRDACKELEPLLDVCRCAVRTLRTPNVALELKRNQLLQAVLDCPTRWDSTVDMLERLISLKDFCKNHHPNLIDDEAWNNIENSVQALKPCKILSKRLQGKDLTFGDFYIAWTQCVTELEELSGTFAVFLIICMKERETNLLNNDTFISAIYLDPRVNSILTDEQNERARNHLIHTYNRLKTLQLRFEAQSENENDPNQANLPREPQPHTSRSIIDTFFEMRYRERHREQRTDTQNQLKNS